MPDRSSESGGSDRILDVRPRPVEIGSFIVDRHGTVLGFDQGMEALTGWQAVEVVGRNKNLPSVHPDRPAALAGPLWEGHLRPALGSGRIRLRLRCKDGRTAEVETAAIGGEQNSPILVHVLRILALSTPRPEPGDSPRRDPLTGLLDRAVFLEQLEKTLVQAVEAALPVALIVVDLDHFRRFNDRWGRLEGDDVLQTVAGILSAEVNDEDLVGRLDDDGMGLILPGAGRGEARVVAARARSLIERIREVETADGALTATLGSASYPADGDCAEDLLTRALDALDEARRLGRNRVWCYQRRPRIPVRTPVYFDAEEPVLLGHTRDLSPSGLFVRTRALVGVGMRCALSFPLRDLDTRIHVIGRVVRTVPEPPAEVVPGEEGVSGMGIEFERFSPEDRLAIEGFLHAHEGTTLRPENGRQSV